jgi:hypothetical protein
MQILSRVPLALAIACAGVAPSPADDLAKQLGDLDSRMVAEAARESARAMWREHLRERIDAANRRSTASWRQVESLADWEQLKRKPIAALRRSLGVWPLESPRLDVRTTGVVRGDGFEIRNLVFASRLGLAAAANLYLPAKAPAKMPGVLICHSHHAPKTSGELQDMGMTWARGGCAVLVMDQLGYGERLQQPFQRDSDFAGSFRRSLAPALLFSLRHWHSTASGWRKLDRLDGLGSDAGYTKRMCRQSACEAD